MTLGEFIVIILARDEVQDMGEDQAAVWQVEDVINSRTVKGVVQYRVRWTGCTEFKDTWGIIDHLYNCPKMLKEFQQKFHGKSREAKEVCL